MKFPHKCTRCGFCCIAETCITGQMEFGIEKRDPCPALSFDGAIAHCGLHEIIPTGDGCCISARAFRDGVEYDFAGLPGELKALAVQSIRKSSTRMEVM